MLRLLIWSNDLGKLQKNALKCDIEYMYIEAYIILFCLFDHYFF